MTGMLLFLLPKLPAAFVVCFAIYQFRNARRRKRLEAFNYWYLGMAGYGFVASWVSGLLWLSVQALWVLCLLGCAVSLCMAVWQGCCDRRARNVQAKAERDALIASLEADIARQTEERNKFQAAMYGLEAEISQLDQECNEIQNLIRPWQTDENEDSLYPMKMTQINKIQYFNENGGTL